MDEPRDEQARSGEQAWLPPQPPGSAAAPQPRPDDTPTGTPVPEPPQAPQPQAPQPAQPQPPQAWPQYGQQYPQYQQHPHGQAWPQQYQQQYPYQHQVWPQQYQQYPYGQYPAWQQPGWQQQTWAQREPDNDPAIAALTLALCGMGLLFLSLGLSAAIVSPAAGAFAIFFGRRGMQKVDKGETRRYRSAAKAGFVLGIATVVLSLIALAIWIAVIASNPEVFEESRAGAAWTSAMLGRAHG